METMMYVAAGVAVVASAAFFFVGRKLGSSGEVQRLSAAKGTAEETSRRIVADAEREAETLRKSAVVTGKEELMKLREAFEGEQRNRRAEIEREEKRVVERETTLDRKIDVLEQRDKEISRRASEFGRREKDVTE